MLPLSPSWRLDGLSRISPVTFPTSYFTPGEHPPGATVMGSRPPNMDNGLSGFLHQAILSVRFTAHAPHQYLSGAAISPPDCISGRYAPKTQLLLKIGSGIFPFQFCASWRTSSDNSCHPVAFPSSNWFLTTQVAPKTFVFETEHSLNSRANPNTSAPKRV